MVDGTTTLGPAPSLAIHLEQTEAYVKILREIVHPEATHDSIARVVAATKEDLGISDVSV
jgi:hypothetical protein